MRGCNCLEPHRPNGNLRGSPVALWNCVVHGNVFGDARLEIVLTGTQLEILKFISDSAGAGNPTDVEAVSQHFGYSIAASRQAMNVLQCLNFIKRT